MRVRRVRGQSKGSSGKDIHDLTPTRYRYNLDKDLTQVIRPDGQTVSLDYDSGGRLSGMHIARGSYHYSYHPTTGQLTSLTPVCQYPVQQHLIGFICNIQGVIGVEKCQIPMKLSPILALRSVPAAISV
jgi:YD repeat-containing protein